MKKSQKIGINVVEFAQHKYHSKKFRSNYPVSDELMDVMLNEVYKDLTSFVLQRHYNECEFMLREFIESHEPREEKRQALEYNLFWWQILYFSSRRNETNFIEEYIAFNRNNLQKRSIIKSWIREWGKAISKFYFVGYKHSDQILVVVDILTEETLDVIIVDPLAVTPKMGEIVMGTLIPLGDGLYLPIIDFYRFDYEARSEIANHLHPYYDQHLKNSTMHQAFIHVLSKVLQIEHILFTERESMIPSK